MTTTERPTPTDAEREVAAAALGYSSPASAGSFESHANIDGVAQALADQRARYEAVADNLSAVEVALSGIDYVAERIRQVAR